MSSAIRASRSTGLRTSIAGTVTRQTAKNDFAAALRAGGQKEADAVHGLLLADIFQDILMGVEDLERDLKRRSGAPWLAAEVAAVKKQLRTTVARINASSQTSLRR